MHHRFAQSESPTERRSRQGDLLTRLDRHTFPSRSFHRGSERLHAPATSPCRIFDRVRIGRQRKSVWIAIDLWQTHGGYNGTSRAHRLATLLLDPPLHPGDDHQAKDYCNCLTPEASGRHDHRRYVKASHSCSTILLDPAVLPRSDKTHPQAPANAA